MLQWPDDVKKEGPSNLGGLAKAFKIVTKQALKMLFTVNERVISYYNQMIECYQFRCHYAESQEMVCYLKRESYSGPISFEVQQNDI